MSKASPLVGAIGAVDELNCVIGVAIAAGSDTELAGMLLDVQNQLFIAGNQLAAAAGISTGPNMITGAHVSSLERYIDALGSKLPELKQFVLPGGSAVGAYLHLARAIARRAEREVVGATATGTDTNAELRRYLNRLSSLLFVAALRANKQAGITEKHPSY